MALFLENGFTVTVEVVPPAGPDPVSLLASLQSIGTLSFYGFSVASNPVAKPRMSALTMSSLIGSKTGKPVILHCTTRDHNRLSLQGLLWGARAMDIRAVLIATGDFIALENRRTTSSVRDLDVFDLIRLARKENFLTGVVLDLYPERDRLEHSVDRLKQKIIAGAQFAVTQPVFDAETAEILAGALKGLDIPLLLGILPLRTSRHADFLHRKVAGIFVPENIRRIMRKADDPRYSGIYLAKSMLSVSKELFAGACLMPPFGRYEVLFDILG